jgi:hypothetical protein
MSERTDGDEMPETWSCRFCGGSEWKNRADWPNRQETHEAQCPSNPAGPGHPLHGHIKRLEPSGTTLGDALLAYAQQSPENQAAVQKICRELAKVSCFCGQHGAPSGTTGPADADRAAPTSTPLDAKSSLLEQARRLEAAYWHIPTTATDDKPFRTSEQKDNERRPLPTATSTRKD